MLRLLLLERYTILPTVHYDILNEQKQIQESWQRKQQNMTMKTVICFEEKI